MHYTYSAIMELRDSYTCHLAKKVCYYAKLIRKVKLKLSHTFWRKSWYVKQWIAYLGVVFIKQLKESAILPEENYKLWDDLSIYLLVCYSFMYEYDILQSIFVVLMVITS